MAMSELNKIGQILLENYKDQIPATATGESYFKDPVSGELNYHSFSDFSDESELAEVFKEHLGDYGLSSSNFAEIARVAFKLREQRTREIYLSLFT